MGGTAMSLPDDSFLLTVPNLNNFAQLQLQPNESFNDKCGRNVDKLANFMKNECRQFSVAEFRLGGSLKKGTAVRGMADIDVIVFLNDFRDMDDYLAKLPEVLAELKMIIERHKHQQFYEIEDKPGRHALKVKLRADVNDEYLEVDVLPACNNLSRCTAAEIYCEMSTRTTKEREYYSSSLAPLQVEFVRDKTKNYANVKNLIRLVKYWRKTHVKQLSEMFPSKTFPTSYAFELLTIHRWEQASSPLSFSMEKGFKDIMTQLVNYGNISASWSICYDASLYDAVTKTSGMPFILDPANPFNNVCARFNAWNEVSQMAQLSLDCPSLDVVVVSQNWR